MEKVKRTNYFVGEGGGMMEKEKRVTLLLNFVVLW